MAQPQKALQSQAQNKARKSVSASGKPTPIHVVMSVENDPPPSDEEIAGLAYTYWEARTGIGGSPEDDWLRAEGELKAARTKRSK